MKDFIINPDFSGEYFYAFENTQGIQASFCFYDSSLFSYIENKEEDLLNKIEQKYDISNNLFTYYKNMIVQGKIFRDVFYVYSIVYIDNEFSPGLYETVNITSILELPTPRILLTKIKLDDIINLDKKGMVLTQQDGVDYSSKKFILA